MSAGGATVEGNDENRLKEPMRIAQMATELRIAFLAQMLSVTAMLHPSTPILEWHLQLLGVPEDFPIDLMEAADGQGIRFSAREVMTAVTYLSSDGLRRDLLAGPMLVGATRLGDSVLKGGFMKSGDPLLQFIRHLRNACAHGDRWHFTGDEPKHPASSRTLTLAASMHGTRATWETVSPHAYVLFLDEVHAYFCQVAVWSAADATLAKCGPGDAAACALVLRDELLARNVVFSDAQDLSVIAQCVAMGLTFRVPVDPRVYKPLEEVLRPSGSTVFG